jgi:IS30 family transposase
MVMISDRPLEGRVVPGHRDDGLILGENSRSALGALVERAIRLTPLLHLPDGKSAEQTEVAMRAVIPVLPASLTRTITWDQGAEMAKRAEFTTATGTPIHFCDPHSPRQRGSNENTNGLHRQDLPKSADLSVFSRAELDAIKGSLNGGPRKTLGYRTPPEKLTELVATAG